MNKKQFLPFGLMPQHEDFLEHLVAELKKEFGREFSLVEAQAWYEVEERKFQATDPEAIAFARM